MLLKATERDALSTLSRYGLPGAEALLANELSLLESDRPGMSDAQYREIQAELSRIVDLVREKNASP